jgi:hypothetical protein
LNSKLSKKNQWLVLRKQTVREKSWFHSMAIHAVYSIVHHVNNIYTVIVM